MVNISTPRKIASEQSYFSEVSYVHLKINDSPVQLGMVRRCHFLAALSTSLCFGYHPLESKT